MGSRGGFPDHLRQEFRRMRARLLENSETADSADFAVGGATGQLLRIGRELADTPA